MTRIDARVSACRSIDIAVHVEAEGHPPATTTVTVGQRPRLRAV